MHANTGVNPTVCVVKYKFGAIALKGDAAMAQQTRCPNCGSYNTFKSGTGNVLFEIIAGFIGIITLGLADIVTHPISNVLQERNWIEGKVKAICHTCKFQFTFNDYPEARASSLSERPTKSLV